MPTIKPVLNDFDFKGVARITNLPAPTSDNEASRKIDLVGAVSSLTTAYQAAVAAEQTARETAIAGLSLGISSATAQSLIEATPLNDIAAPDGDVAMAGYKLTGLGNGTAATDAVNFGQLAQAVAGRLKAVTVQAKYDGVLADLQATVSGNSATVDGVTVADANVGTPAAFTTYVLLQSTDDSETGIYQLSGGTFARLTGFTTASDWVPFINVFVDTGTVYANTVWFNPDPATAGTADAIASLVLSAGGRVGEITVNPSGPLRKSGTQLDLAFHSADFAVDVNGLMLSTTVTDRFSTIESDVLDLDGRLDTAESNISSNSSSISTINSDLSSLTGRVSTAEGEIDTLQSDVASLQSGVSTLQTDVATLQSDVSTAQSDITDLQTLTQQYYWKVTAGVVDTTNAPNGMISYDSGTGRWTIAHNKGVIADIKILEVSGSEASDAIVSKGVPIATMLNEAWVELPATGSYYLVD